MDMVIDEGGDQIVGRRDRMVVSGKVERYLIRGQYLGEPPACSAAL